ncbi:Tensin [Paragonimus heterotremus]|uniref:Tensin n=1 Tax=Paragonimus heterotremus TaxID=100268 RepID=A0A8J4TCJ5_9TREM|nr:Tensin [Paragonimus heterotremus]
MLYYSAHLVPPNYSGNATGAIGGLVDGADWEHQELMKQAKNTFREWYLPDATREDVIYMLRDRDPGSFIIRNSISCVNSFSLGIKAPPYPPQAAATSDFLRSGQVKHFIIGTVPMYDGRGDGVQLCGFNDQPVFPALTDFVSHHCLHPGPLPCALRLPSSISASQQRLGGYDSITKYGVPAGGSGIMVDMLYLGCVPVDRLEKSAAIRKAISHILSLAATSVNGLPKRCEVTIHAKPTEGVKFTDRSKRNLVEKHLKPSQILFCGSDPEGRNYVDAGLRNRGFVHAKTFGILIRKKQLWMHENLVYVFSELDPNQSAVTLINYISHTFTS